MTAVNVYNGNQIGGCVVTVETDAAKVVIDFGENLTGRTGHPVELDGLTYGERSYDAVFFTHYHGDHMGRIADILPDIPLYIGHASRAITLTIAQTVHNEKLTEILQDDNRITELTENRVFTIGDIRITPYTVDHSAYEAFMFLIETPDKKILHTGDFREHGFRGKKGLIPTIRKYIKKYGERDIDILITEGTMLTRREDPAYTEADLMRDAISYFKDHRYVFLLISSTNADSLAAFYQAAQKYGMQMYGNYYVVKQLHNFREFAGSRSSLYDFENVHQWDPDAKLRSASGWSGTQFDILSKHGFVTIIKGNADYEKWIREFENRSGKKTSVIYSMWRGYILPGKNQDPELAAFCQAHDAVYMHTSGHAYADTLAKVITEVNPLEAIIPIHTEYAAGIRELPIAEELKKRIIIHQEEM